MPQHFTAASSERYLRDGDFRDHRLKPHGLVEHPVELSAEQLRDLAHSEQITMHNCILGWSATGKWGGLPFSKLIELVQPKPETSGSCSTPTARAARKAPTTTRTPDTTCATRRACSLTR